MGQLGGVAQVGRTWEGGTRGRRAERDRETETATHKDACRALERWHQGNRETREGQGQVGVDERWCALSDGENELAVRVGDRERHGRLSVLWADVHSTQGRFKGQGHAVGTGKGSHSHDVDLSQEIGLNVTFKGNYQNEK